ncbi:MAG: RNA polymerase-associated protein RapA [Xanthomonadales bacterium]|nr:RNA polymerase-associated protein RapA [Xanthomonadales bacterium]
MPVSSIQPGQRWVSNTESELGLGIVLEVANRRVSISFPAAGEKRTYAVDIAPLSRVRYEVDQQVSNIEGRSMLITEVEEHNGCLIYAGIDENDQVMVLPELELDSFVQFSKPQERLFAGQIDKNRAFELRLSTLRYYRQQQQSPVAGLTGARIQLLPHQLYIASETANRYAPRVLLADEVGLGKTIEAGLIIHQQLFSGRAKRVLIVVPDSLVHQWLVEMLRRFNLYFTILDEDRCLALVESGNENPFESAQLILCSMSLLTAQTQRVEQAAEAGWDLLVVDEAHHLEWNKQKASPAYSAIESLSEHTSGLLLLTATPEQLGIEDHFARLRLLDPARYFDIENFREEEARYAPVNELVQRLLAKNGLQQLKSESVQVRLEAFLGKTATANLLAELDKDDGEPQAILNRLIRELLDRHGTGRVLFRNTRSSIEGFPERELHQHLLQTPEMPDSEPKAEAGDDLASVLMPETALGNKWLKTDTRVIWLLELLKQQRDNKILVICARAETALELEQHLNLKHGVHSAVFHEGLSLVARDRAAAYFADEDEGAQVLVCSEIGSEGRNFQFSNQLVLFDLPLNPDLLEQRIGRLDRIGQRHHIQLHVPCYENSAQHVLLRWYHEGVNAFEHTCAIGQNLYEQFKKPLHQCLTNPADQSAVDELILNTRSSANVLLEKLTNGRDRLLELNSCDSGRAEQIVEDMHEQEQRRALSNYMEQIFDQFGVDQEHHSANSVVLRPGEHMLGHSFPALPEDGLTATYHRELALLREEFHYLTWEHPMVTGAMDMVMNGEFGNNTICTMKLPPLKTGTILLEAIFTMSCAAPPALQLHRFLPLTVVRVVVDSKQNDLSNILTEKHFNRLGQKVRRHTSQDFVRHAHPQIVAMIKQAEQLAGSHEQPIIKAATTKMKELQSSELQRLQALAEVNPNIRQEEIDYLKAEASDIQHHLDSTHIKLDALRLAVVVE